MRISVQTFIVVQRVQSVQEGSGGSDGFKGSRGLAEQDVEFAPNGPAYLAPHVAQAFIQACRPRMTVLAVLSIVTLALNRD
jgi:hypothetical protein